MLRVGGTRHRAARDRSRGRACRVRRGRARSASGRRWWPSSSPRATSSPGSSRARTGEVAPAEAARLLRVLHTRRADPRPVRPVPRRRGLRRHRTRGRSAAARRLRAGAVRSPTGSSGGCGRARSAPCHNDLLAANFIRGAQRLWIVDWEYAGMGDPAFDLANFAVNNGLDADGDRALLEAYGGADGGAAHADAVHVGLPRGDVGGRAAGARPSSTSTSRATRTSTSPASSRRPRSRASAARSSDRRGAAGPGADRQARRSARALGAYISIASYTSTEPPLAKIGQSFVSATAASRLSAATLE